MNLGKNSQKWPGGRGEGPRWRRREHSAAATPPPPPVDAATPPPSAVGRRRSAALGESSDRIVFFPLFNDVFFSVTHTRNKKTTFGSRYHVCLSGFRDRSSFI